MAQTNEYMASHLSRPERSLRQYGELAEIILLDYPYPFSVSEVVRTKNLKGYEVKPEAFTRMLKLESTMIALR